MPNWDTIAQRDFHKRTKEDFEAAAYRMIAEQVLYHADKASRATYWIVEQYEREFRDALDMVGVDLGVNREKKYVFALPRHASAQPVSVSATLVALVLRKLYDEYARQGAMSEHGEVFVDLVGLEEKYRLITGREMPGRSEFEQIMKQMRRWGIVRKTTEDEPTGDPTLAYAVVIRPAIIEVLGEMALSRMTRWQEHGEENASRANRTDEAPATADEALDDDEDPEETQEDEASLFDASFDEEKN